ncbi:S26 family signal peptidase [Faecalibaculum rodentium]|uniref:Peptidase S26 domain-containing protein n=1 Tax=Faecalibaculum rodentium TaxID=1702221 RepID=A0A1Q9YI45_9FIRM|nr:S26 family signal peptidase [Faecalibaculum rodentium]OLU43905.1 hypothetical protein BO223_10225 [Faecalibaculum rodentium]
MDRPTSSEVRQELDRVKHGRTYRKTLKSTIYILVTVAAFAVLVATLWMPVLEVYGGSMEPTLQEGELVAAVKSGDFKTGDVVAFYYNVSDVNYPSMTNPSVAGQYRHGGILHDWT